MLMRDFYQRTTEVVARELLGKLLVRAHEELVAGEGDVERRRRVRCERRVEAHDEDVGLGQSLDAPGDRRGR